MLPSSFYELRALQSVDLSHNSLHTVGEHFERMISLHTLDLSGNENINVDDLPTRTRRLHEKVLSRFRPLSSSQPPTACSNNYWSRKMKGEHWSSVLLAFVIKFLLRSKRQSWSYRRNMVTIHEGCLAGPCLWVSLRGDLREDGGAGRGMDLNCNYSFDYFWMKDWMSYVSAALPVTLPTLIPLRLSSHLNHYSLATSGFKKST